MKGYVDEGQGVVRVEGQSWPFELDCRAGTVALKLDGEPVRVRRPSWREKRNLARFIHLGEGFLKDQFLRLSLVDESALPEIPAEREALWALARWLSGPQGNCGLPLDQELLARVTLDLCLSMGWSPAALEELEADEVEALWRAAGGEGRPAEEKVSGTRILVVPDPEPSGATMTGHPISADRTGAQPITQAKALSAGSGQVQAEQESPAAISPQNPGEAGTSFPTFQPPAARAGAPVRSAAQGPGTGSPADAGDSLPKRKISVPGRQEKADKTHSRPQGRFRVILSAAPTDYSGDEVVIQSSRCTEFSPTGAQDQSPPASSFQANAGTPKGAAVARMQEPPAATFASNSAAVAQSPVEAGLPAPQGISSWAQVPWEPPAPVKPAEVDFSPIVGAGDNLENFFEEFAERLETAAGAMGIDLET